MLVLSVGLPWMERKSPARLTAILYHQPVRAGFYLSAGTCVMAAGFCLLGNHRVLFRTRNRKCLFTTVNLSKEPAADVAGSQPGEAQTALPAHTWSALAESTAEPSFREEFEVGACGSVLVQTFRQFMSCLKIVVSVGLQPILELLVRS